MPAPKWTTQEQFAFLVDEDKKWHLIKAGNTSLKSFYIRTTNTFLVKWPVEPDEKTLKRADGDIGKAKVLAEEKLLDVS